MKTSPAVPWLMLVSRSALFLLAQALIAAGFLLAGNAEPWYESARWWPFMAVAANIASLALLVWLFRREGERFWALLRFKRATLKGDLLWLAGSTVVSLPLAAAPMIFLAVALWGDRMVPVNLMFRPLPSWAFIFSFLFPLTIWFAELPTYFLYVMPRLAEQIKNGWAAWLIAAFVLAAQHIFLPFLPDGRFVLWRLGMFLPFALFVGLMIKLRPTLLPYLLIIHALADISTVLSYTMM